MSPKEQAQPIISVAAKAGQAAAAELVAIYRRSDRALEEQPLIILPKPKSKGKT